MSNTEMRVCAVIVTYGDRFKFLNQVINASIKEGVNKIIVVDNNSHPKSRKQLKGLEHKFKDKLKVIYLNKNIGSAGGFKKGLKEAYRCKECEFIWLLDDDNIPTKDALKELKEFWNSFKMENKEENLCLLSFRPDRIIYKEAVMKVDPNLVLGRKNSFLGFHILDLPKKVIKIAKKKLGIETFKENPNIKSGQVAIAPYGGMFFNKKILDKIGYPQEKFFVYVDDHEWSYRITINGGKIILVLNSLLKDIDTSWYLKQKNVSPFYSYLNMGDDFRVYYSVRNKVFFEQNIQTNKFIYNLNKNLFLLLLYFYRNKKNKKRFSILKKAIIEGTNKYEKNNSI